LFVRRRLRVMVSEDLWRAIHIEALNGASISSMIEDALAIYLALKHGEAGLTLKPGVNLNLTTIRGIEPCGPGEPSQPQARPEPKPSQVQVQDAPSFVRDNPWLSIIASKGG
jgi:hypothetical protein